jgi:hypothetical protein
VRFDDWLKKFTALHDKARSGKLTIVENRTYVGARNELARALLKKHAQKIPHGAQARQIVRAPAALPVALHLPGNVTQAVTQELWTGGFSTIIPPLSFSVDRLKFALTLTKDAPPIEGWAHVLSDLASRGSTRLTVEFEKLSDADAERVEFAVFDSVLLRLGGPGTM